jgi:hypothetical protein
MSRTVRLGKWLLVASLALASVQAAAAQNKGIDKGQRVLTAGHSFHIFVPAILKDIALSAGIKDHVQVDQQGIGGSRVIQHWNVPDEKNKIKIGLRTGKVDVLTLSPIAHPDEGIDNFTKLALEHNPNIRITVQASWAAYDLADRTKLEKVDRNARTPDDLRRIHAAYFQSVDAQVQALNKQYGKQVLYVVPVGHAVVRLREKIIAGQAPGLKTQAELFTDAIGHVRQPVQVLNAYCHFAVIYRRSPVGLPMPAALRNAKNPSWDDKLNRLLQELAWEAAIRHPLSGVQ